MFSLFRTKKNYFLGIDFGTSSIKVVELAYKNSQAVLSNYGWVDFGDDGDLGEIDQEDKKEELVKYLKILLDRMKVRSDAMYTAIPSYNGLSVIVDFPNLSDEELAKAIRLEAGKHIPSPLNEVYLSWDVVLKTSKKGGIFDKSKEKSFENKHSKSKDEKDDRIEVLLVAATKEEVLNYEDIVKRSGFKINSLELDIFSMSRSLIGEDLGAHLIIDIGSRVTNIILVDKGVVRINRSLSVGGNKITGAIKSSMNVTWSRAEKYKKKSRDFFSSREAVNVLPIFDSISSEAKRVLDEYGRKINKKDNVVSSVIVSGGTSMLLNIDRYFSDALGAKVVHGNPWKRVKVKNSALEERLHEISPAFSVAVGLALKGVDDYCRDV